MILATYRSRFDVHHRWMLAVCMMFLCLTTLTGTAVLGQDPEPANAEESEFFPDDVDDASDDVSEEMFGDEEESNDAFRGTTQEDLDLIEGLLEDSDESIDTGFVYDPSGRRDPFRTLLRAADTVDRSSVQRPEGIPGLLIDNLTVTGVWMWPEGPVAQVQSADETISFLLRPGTRVFDGEVLSVTWNREEGGKVVFRQVVRDPNSPKPFREVVRRVQL